RLRGPRRRPRPRTGSRRLGTPPWGPARGGRPPDDNPPDCGLALADCRTKKPVFQSAIRKRQPAIPWPPSGCEPGRRHPAKPGRAAPVRAVVPGAPGGGRGRLSVRPQTPRPDRRPDAVAGGHHSRAILGLLGLLLGFTFAMAVSRFDSRKQLVVDEANTLGT